KTFTPAQMKGKVWLLNAWASWCRSCRLEHPVLLDLARQGVVSIIGFDYQDQRDAGAETLAKHGDPYQLSVLDGDGRVGVDLGIAALPETFVIDKQGRIRYKFTGPVTPALLKEKLLPLIAELQRG